MKHKIAILILGHRNAGKSSTFYELFGRIIRTGNKKFVLNNKNIRLFVENSSFEEMGQDIMDDVFVRNSSFEEYGDEAEDYFDENNLPKIILCAVQYKEKGIRTIEYFKNNGYYLYIQWLNPGYNDSAEYKDHLGFEERFAKYGEFHKITGKENTNRVQDISKFLSNFMLSNRC